MTDYEQFIALAQSRRSVRKFADRPISRQDLLRVIDAARWAPSNHNRQPWRFLIIQNRQKMIQLARRVEAGLSDRLRSLPAVASGYIGEFTEYATFFSKAPVLIVVLHKLPVSFSRPLWKEVAHPELVSGEPLSAAMAVQNLLLAAHTLELGACVLTAPLIVYQAVAGDLKLPAGYEVTCLVALGYPDENPPQPRRKSVEQITEFNEDAQANNDD